MPATPLLPWERPHPPAKRRKPVIDPMPPDGLYRVTTPTMCAGFVIRDRRVASCAPILWKGLRAWMRQSPPVLERIGPP